MFLWMVALEVIKQVCCVSRVCKERSQIRQTTCFLLVTALFFIDRKTKVLPHFAFTRSVLSLMEEGEHSSVAIFTLVLVHMHACFCARTWHGAGSIYQYLSIFLLYITVRIFLDIIDIITHHYFLHPLAG